MRAASVLTLLMCSYLGCRPSGTYLVDAVVQAAGSGQRTSLQRAGRTRPLRPGFSVVQRARGRRRAEDGGESGARTPDAARAGSASRRRDSTRA
ncbi:hypothetical protein C2E23DRAFT_841194 [Lenzites betulinus]|nr:hypothetical protein C2E23DRAFT_841194 [Lenzites betulinus]